MAYMRGPIYLWDDKEERLHIWVADGLDGWEDAGWHFRDEEGQDLRVEPGHLVDGENVASGVSIPHGVMDEYLMMRRAELLEEGKLCATLERALQKWNRLVLENNADKLRAMFGCD